jgi:DNA-binding SARP family transcriptional activator/tetratricopeptide (TPR) repeat protein
VLPYLAVSRPLRLDLLGGFRVCLEGERPLSLPTRKSEALLAYLALPPGRFHPRDKLAALLWGDAAETHARQSFRQALGSLRRVLGAGHPAIVLTQGETVALNPEAVTVDVTELEAAIGERHTAALARVAILYKGDFLAGLRVNEPPFEEWRAVQRERLHELALEGLARLLREQVQTEHIESSIQTALRILAMDSLQEAIHRTLMRLLVRQGRRAAALEQYQACVSLLRRELDTEPEEQTRALYREILRVAAGSPTASPDPLQRTRSETALVGRDREMDTLRGALTHLFDVGGRVVLIHGEAGIGKSRLIAELVGLAEASGARVALGRCHETERALPLHPWVDALRGDRPNLDPRVRDLLASEVGAQLIRVFPELLEKDEQPITALEQHVMLFDAFVELIRQLAIDRPMVLILEDVHRADAMSARLLAFLGRRIHRLPVLLVVSVRPEDVVEEPLLRQMLEELRGTGDVEDIVLGPLTQAESQALIRSFGGARIEGQDLEPITAEIWSVSRGNPFVIVESVRELQQNPQPTGVAGPRLATRIEDGVGRRLDRLSDPARHVVEVAAAIGRDFSYTLVQHAAHLGEPEAATAVEELVRRRIFNAIGDRLDFCHEWIRRVAYARLVPARKPSVHRAIGEALERIYQDRTDEVPDQISRHYALAGETRRALAYLLRCAEIAAHRYALDDAYATLAQAARAIEHWPAVERDRWHLDIALRQTFVMSLQGRQREISGLLRARAGLVRRVAEPALTSDYCLRSALLRWYLGEHVEARLLAEHALHEGERAQSPERMGRAHYVLALNCVGLGLLAEGVAHAESAVAILDERHTRHWRGLAYFALALNHVIAGECDAALEAGDRCAAIGRDEHDPRLESGGGYVVAWVHITRGDVQAAIALARQTLERSRDAVAVCLASGVLGWAYVECGDPGAAIPLLEETVERLAAIPLRLTEGRFRSILSEAYLRAGDAERAVQSARQALALSDADGNPLTRGLAERALGRVAQASGDAAEAGRLLAEALATFEAMGATVEAAQVHIDLAGLMGARGDVEGAGEHLRAAEAIFEAAGALERAAGAQAAILGNGQHRQDPRASLQQWPSTVTPWITPAESTSKRVSQ